MPRNILRCVQEAAKPYASCICSLACTHRHLPLPLAPPLRAARVLYRPDRPTYVDAGPREELGAFIQVYCCALRWAGRVVGERGGKGRGEGRS